MPQPGSPPTTGSSGRGTSRRTVGVESPRKVLQVLLGFSEQRPHATIQEIAADVNVPQSTAYRYVSLLRELGLLEEGAAATYHVAPRIIGVAQAATAANPLARIAKPIMQELVARIDETVFMVRAIGGHAVCVELVEASRAVRLSMQPGHPLPLHSGASGKTLLAFMPEFEREAILQARLKEQPWLVAEADALRKELDAIRSRRWATSFGEIDEGIWACAAPVLERNRAVATLSTAGPAYRISEAERERIATLLREFAARITAQYEATRH
jgi:DNA-binding IclR family transcriptional regulator